MAISRFKTSSVAQGLPKYQKLWDQTSGLTVRTNLGLWLDASDPETFSYSSSNVISQWNDKSGNGRHAIQPTTASQPTRVSNVMNGLPAVRFDGSDDFIYSSPAGTINGSTNFSIFWTFNYRSNTSDYDPFMTPYASGADRGSFHYVNPSRYGAAYPMYTSSTPWGNYDLAAGYQYPAGSFHTMEFHANGQGNPWTVYRNGTLEGSGTTGSTHSDLTRLEFGRQSNPSRYSAFDIGEVLIYSSVVTPTQAESIRSYLRSKWGTI